MDTVFATKPEVAHDDDQSCGHSVRCGKQIGVLDGDGRVVAAVPFGVSPFSG